MVSCSAKHPFPTVFTVYCTVLFLKFSDIVGPWIDLTVENWDSWKSWNLEPAPVDRFLLTSVYFLLVTGSIQCWDVERNEDGYSRGNWRGGTVIELSWLCASLGTFGWERKGLLVSSNLYFTFTAFLSSGSFSSFPSLTGILSCVFINQLLLLISFTSLLRSQEITILGFDFNVWKFNLCWPLAGNTPQHSFHVRFSFCKNPTETIVKSLNQKPPSKI